MKRETKTRLRTWQVIDNFASCFMFNDAGRKTLTGNTFRQALNNLLENSSLYNGELLRIKVIKSGKYYGVGLGITKRSAIWIKCKSL